MQVLAGEKVSRVKFADAEETEGKGPHTKYKSPDADKQTTIAKGPEGRGFGSRRQMAK